MRIWGVMDECIRAGVSTSETVLPGRLGLRRRAPMLYRRLMRGFGYISKPYVVYNINHCKCTDFTQE